MSICSYINTVVSPRAELHETFLLVKWKELDVDWTITFIDDRGFPDDKAGMEHFGFN